ncbi:NTP transferase domain-containing protein [Akkermansiaceae bacterium]|nr:NTP transferase domain-containing protein [Akkermansiaceae bacterium]
MPSLIVLAAGMGSRYGGLKQIDPMGPNGETVLDYSVYDAIRAGFDRVIFVIREDFADAFREGIGARFAGKIRVDYAFQKLDDLPAPFTPPEGRSKPWGTTHAVRAARHLIDGPFAVINADDFYGRDAYARAAGFLADISADTCALIAYPLENTLSDHGQVNRGICGVSAEGLLESVEEFVKIGREADGRVTGEGLDGVRSEIPASAPASMNFWLFPAEFVQDLEGEFMEFLGKHFGMTGESYIPTVVDSLIRKGKTSCRAITTSSSWFGVTYAEDKDHVVKAIADLIAAGEYPNSLGD